MQIDAHGKVGDTAAYHRFIKAVVEHWDKFTRIRSGFNDKRQRAGRLNKSDFEQVIEDSVRPNSDWHFVLESDDEEFLVWFRMMYF